MAGSRPDSVQLTHSETKYEERHGEESRLLGNVEGIHYACDIGGDDGGIEGDSETSECYLGGWDKRSASVSLDVRWWIER